MFTLPADRPALMGILNVTPDSFSDGGRFLDKSAAIDHALQMVEHGADLIDVGGESTRPGANHIEAQEEMRRVIPIIEELASRGLIVSVDTYKATVAKEALSAGAQIVNDVSALSDHDMAEVCAHAGCTVCLMHSRGTAKTMQQQTQYEDVVQEVALFLEGRVAYAHHRGIRKEAIWIDPGIGFAKTKVHNLTLLRQLRTFVDMGSPVMIGVSRKSFIGQILGDAQTPLPVTKRLPGTLAAQVIAQLLGARIIRAHDVLESRNAIDIACAILASEGK